MRAQVNRRPRLQTESIPPPVGGLNTLDAVANMEPTDAIIMDNYFPGTADVPLRNGYETWAPGLTNVETLAAYTSGTQKKLFAVAGGKVYDVTASQAVGSGNVVVEGPFTGVAGQTTLALSQTYGKSADLLVHFDGQYQGYDQYTVGTNSITFNSPIPPGTVQVYIESIGAPDASITAEGPFTGVGGQTVLTLSQAYAGATSLLVYFDGTYQGYDQYSVSANHITFTSAIPNYVGKVYIIGVSIGNIATEGPFTGSGQTTLTLSKVYPSSANLVIHFDGGFQGPDQYTISGTTLTFAAAVPAGVLKIYVVAFGSSIISGLTNSRWQWVNFSNAGLEFLIMVNGVDPMLLYNGTTWQEVTESSTPIAITGVDPHLFGCVNVFANRLWFGIIDTLQSYYLPIGQVGGAAALFDIGPQTTLGGYLMGMATWNIDDSAGLNPYIVFVSSEGECVVYQGSDPSQASSFGIAAHFRIGRPPQRRFYEKYGSDIVFLGSDGLTPLSQALISDRSTINASLTRKISPSVTSDVAAYGAHYGWQVVLYPDGKKLLVNVPTAEDVSSYTYVMNTTTNAWCRFTGWNAICYCYFNGALYFGGPNGVALADVGSSDGLNAINGDIKPAFSYFGNRGVQKYFKMIKPVFLASSSFALTMDLSTDFSNSLPTSTPSFSQGSVAPWNTTPWDKVPWSGAQVIQSDWESIDGIGYAATYRMRTATANVSFSIESATWLYEPQVEVTL
ncbi:hypothetical protein ABH944_004861 [Caballeronia udeis]|uniref:Uncharacterized protein n=1 Tax=Caballeronia udeis TaxID=1232866 RepID=A0ABW8MLT9_9BURK